MCCCSPCFFVCGKNCVHAGCGRCVLVALNIPMTFIGIILLSVFGYTEGMLNSLAEDDVNLVKNSQMLTLNAATVIGLIVGVMLVVAGFIGCCGSCFDSVGTIVAYIVFLVIIMFLEMSVVVITFAFESSIEHTEAQRHLEIVCHVCSGFVSDRNGMLNIVAWVLMGILAIQAGLLYVSAMFIAHLKDPRMTVGVVDPLTEIHTRSIPSAVRPVDGTTSPKSSMDRFMMVDFSASTTSLQVSAATNVHPGVLVCNESSADRVNSDPPSQVLSTEGHMRTAQKSKKPSPLSLSLTQEQEEANNVQVTSSKVSSILCVSPPLPPPPPPPPPPTPISANFSGSQSLDTSVVLVQASRSLQNPNMKSDITHAVPLIITF